MLHDGDKPIARMIDVHFRQRFERAAQGGQRILEFMCDIGGEAFNCVQTIIERLRHLAQRARQVTDLVRSRGEIGNLLARPDATPHAFGRVGEPPDRFGDCVGEG